MSACRSGLSFPAPTPPRRQRWRSFPAISGPSPRLSGQTTDLGADAPEPSHDGRTEPLIPGPSLPQREAKKHNRPSRSSVQPMKKSQTVADKYPVSGWRQVWERMQPQSAMRSRFPARRTPYVQVFRRCHVRASCPAGVRFIRGH
jgi:hypothetical protein